MRKWSAPEGLECPEGATSTPPPLPLYGVEWWSARARASRRRAPVTPDDAARDAQARARLGLVQRLLHADPNNPELNREERALNREIDAIADRHDEARQAARDRWCARIWLAYGTWRRRN